MITFESSDIKRPTLEALAKEIATAVLKYRSRIADITAFLKRSGNTLDSYNRFYKMWSSQFNKRKSPADVLQFSSLIGKIGTVCTSNKDWQKLRGLLAESLFEPYFEKKHAGSLKGYGVIVLIDGEPVLYRPEVTTETDRNRQSIDAGAWNGEQGEFVEVKFSPSAFQEKDINYLKLLEQRLEDKEIAHKIILATFDDVIITKGELVSKNLIDDSSKFEIIGQEDFVQY